MGEFYGERIEVNYNQIPGMKLPQSFVWRGKNYRIEKIIDTWSDHGFGSLGSRPKWWLRRHRNYYRVATSEGEIFEIYYDRGAKEKCWVIYQKISLSELKPAISKPGPPSRWW